MGNVGCTKTDAISLRIEVKHLRKLSVCEEMNLLLIKMFLQHKGQEREMMCHISVDWFILPAVCCWLCRAA